VCQRARRICGRLLSPSSPWPQRHRPPRLTGATCRRASPSSRASSSREQGLWHCHGCWCQDRRTGRPRPGSQTFVARLHGACRRPLEPYAEMLAEMHTRGSNGPCSRPTISESSRPTSSTADSSTSRRTWSEGGRSSRRARAPTVTSSAAVAYARSAPRRARSAGVVALHGPSVVEPWSRDGGQDGGARVKRPRLEGDDVADIVAFIRGPGRPRRRCRR